MLHAPEVTLIGLGFVLIAVMYLVWMLPPDRPRRDERNER